MRLTEFRVPVKEAPIDDLKAKYAEMLKQLKLEPGDDEGFFGRNFRNNANNEILAQFAKDNDLPGMFNPETGRFIKFGEDEEGMDSGMVDDISTPDFDQLQQLADLGAIPPAAQDELAKEIEAYDTGERSLYRKDLIGNLLGKKNPEDRDRLLDILKRNSTSGKDQGTTAPVDKDGKPTGDAAIPNLDLPATATPADQTASARDADDAAELAPGADVAIPDLDKPAGAAKPEPAKQEPLVVTIPAPANPLATKPGDYTGADGVEDMSTGMFVKPDAPAGKPAGAAKPEPAKQEPPAAAKPEKRGKVKATAANTRDYDKTIALQKELIKRGAKIKADGLMGPNTRAAMKKFGNKPAGAAKPEPAKQEPPAAAKPEKRRKVKATAANTRDYDKTLALQKQLISRGAKIKADGIMGPNTQRALDAEIARRNKADAAKQEPEKKKVVSQPAPLPPAPKVDQDAVKDRIQQKRDPKGTRTATGTMARSRQRAQDRAKKQGAAKPGDTRSWWERNAPSWLGGEPDPVAKSKAPVAKPNAPTNAVPAPVLDIPGAEKTKVPAPVLKKKDKPIPKISQNFTNIPQTQMAGKEFTKPKLETRDDMRSLQDKLNEIAERD